MKKTSKILSFIIGSAIAIGTMGSLSANAVYMESSNIPLTPPDGEELYELDCENGEVSYRITSGKGLSVYGFDFFTYNNITIKVKDGDNAYEIAEKYLSDLKFDEYLLSRDNSSIYLYDKHVSGDDPRTHESVEDKYKQLSAICAQMYEDGVVEEAILVPMQSSYYTGKLHPIIDCSYLYGPNKEMFQDKVDELQALVDQYTEYGEVSIHNYDGPNSGKYYISVNLQQSEFDEESGRYVHTTDFDTYDKLAALRDEIAERYDYENVGIECHIPETIDEYAASPEINLLDPYICDIDASGKADISDASTILNAYAENAAGMRTAVDDKMDVNSDGNVNVEDAMYVLNYYSQAAAGIR